MIRKISLLLCTILLIFSLITINYQVSAVTIDGIVSGADNFIGAGKDGDSLLGEDAVKEFSDLMYNALLAVGIIAAVIVGTILGIKIAAAGTEERAQTKELLVPYFVGVVILFGAFAIWKIVVNILQ